MKLTRLSSDLYDNVTRRLALLTSPSTTPTTFSLTATHLIVILLPPAFLLPLLPNNLLPVVLLPLGIAPPLFFHPNLTPAVLSLPRHPAILRLRAVLENLALTDALPDDIGRKEIGRVEVWENERLDPTIAAKPQGSTSTALPTPAGAWSSRHLRASERNPWVKVLTASDGKSLWGTEETSSGIEGEKMVLALEYGWAFIPGEDWRVDVCGMWSTSGTDEEGWAYSDDSWQVGFRIVWLRGKDKSC